MTAEALAAPMPQPGTSPQVSVLIAVRNGGRYLEPALRSMMAQTLRDIEIIVVDDASTDGTPDVLRRLAAEDGRIRVETLGSNLRLPRALNHGLTLARAPLVARMDADDISDPTRLEQQARYMAAHPGTVLLGTSYRQIDADGRLMRTHVRPRDAFAVRWIARLHLPMIHPSFMFRSRLPNGEAPRYDPDWTHSEDYDLIVRLLGQGDAAVLSEVLVSYRVHGDSILGSSWDICQQQGKAISHRYSAETLPHDLVEGLRPVRSALYEGERAEVPAIFAGLRALAAHDVARAPARRAWIRRQAAQIARQAMERSGRRGGEVVRAFLGPGRDFLPDMALRALEAKRWLPAQLNSEAPVAPPPTDARPSARPAWGERVPAGRP